MKLFALVSRRRRITWKDPAKAAPALKSGATIAIGEWLVNDGWTEPLNGLMFAVNMLVNTERGDTFSFNEIKSWLEEAGLQMRGLSRRRDRHRSCWQQNLNHGRRALRNS